MLCIMSISALCYLNKDYLLTSYDHIFIQIKAKVVIIIFS